MVAAALKKKVDRALERLVLDLQQPLVGLVGTQQVHRGDHRLGHVFFFSSRRPHTRSTRDWSSDVCSSDLHEELIDLIEAGHRRIVLDFGNVERLSWRSEERRVGKECRSWWSSYAQEKK